jgi:hypothetical protein
VNPSKIDEWMSTASQIATGGRRQVPEDGPDVINSESDSDNEQHGDQLTGAYIGISTNSNGDPESNVHHMENSQAHMARLLAKVASSTGPQAPQMDSPPPVYERKATPLNSDDESPPLSYEQERTIGHARKMARAPLEKSSQASESTHGMTTRSQVKMASGAGCLRPAVGSGQTATCVANGHPSYTWVVIFLLRRGFLLLAIQRVQWTSVTLLPCHSQGVLDCTPPVRRPYGPLSGAVKTPLGPDQVNVLSLSTRTLSDLFR